MEVEQRRGPLAAQLQQTAHTEDFAHLPIPQVVGAPPALGWLLRRVGRPPDFAALIYRNLENCPDLQPQTRADPEEERNLLIQVHYGV